MGGEAHPFLTLLGERRKAHHLVAARVSEDRAFPAHEFVQPAQPRHPLRAGAEHEVIGVAEDDVRAGRPHLRRPHRLHCRGSADWHEGRRADHPALHGNLAGAGGAIGGVDGEGKTGRHDGAAPRRGMRKEKGATSRPPLSPSQQLSADVGDPVGCQAN